MTRITIPVQTEVHLQAGAIGKLARCHDDLHQGHYPKAVITHAHRTEAGR